jgi:hypothetical protein
MNIDLNKIPKQFCENAMIGHSSENFVMAIIVGEAVAAYALTPQHMKRFAQNAAHQIAEYEKKFDTINAAWAPGIESPIQTKDLKEGT